MARQMKDSGIEWIGEIPAEWAVSRVKYVSDFEPGCNRDGLTDESVITYTPMDCIKNGWFINNTATLGSVSNSLTAYQNGDIVMAKVTPCFENGNIAIMENLASGYGLGSSELFVFRPVDIDTRYFFYWLRNPMFVQLACSTMTGTGGLKRVSPYFAKNCYIHQPPLAEQQRIAASLDRKCAEIDAVIERTKATIEEYKKLKQAVITEAVTKGVRGPRPMKDSGIEWIGEIPETWNITRIGRLCFVTKLAGFEFTDHMMQALSEEGDVPIVRAQHIKMGRFLDNPTEYISFAVSQKLSRCALDQKCLIITFIGAGIGEVALFDKEQRYHLAPNVAKIVITQEMKQYISEEYLLYFLMSSAGQEEVNKIKKATAQPSLSMETIRSIKILIPESKEEQAEITAYLDKQCTALDTIIAKKTALLTELETYKKSLIYEYVTGKKEVQIWPVE